MKWRQTKTVPEDTWVLLIGPAGVHCIGKLVYERGVGYWDVNQHKVHRYKVFTHWMSLPPPPAV